MSELVAGVAYVKVDGRQFNLEGSLKVMPSRIKRTGLVGLSGPLPAFKQEWQHAAIEGAFFADRGVTFQDLENVTNATVQIELADGRAFVMRNAWSTAGFEIDAAAGTFTLRFEAPEMVEI